MSIEKGWESHRRMQAVSDEEVRSMQQPAKLSSEMIDAGIRYYHSDPGLSEAILVQGIYEAMKAANGKQQGGEVQGNAHVVVLREMRARLTDAGSPARTAALDAAISALAACQPGVE